MPLRFIEYKPRISGGLKEALEAHFSHPDYVDSVWVNYGNSTLVPHHAADNCDLMLNHPDFVALAVSKFKALTKWGRIQPEAFSSPRVVRDGSNNAILLKQIGGHGGIGTKYFANTRSILRWPVNSYVEEYIPCDQEWRVFVVGSKTCVRLKVGGQGIIRSARFGWTYKWVPDVPSTIRSAGVEAIRTLGLDFGAVDVGERLNLPPVVYEANTAPRLSAPSEISWFTRTLTAYIESKLEELR